MTGVSHYAVLAFVSGALCLVVSVTVFRWLSTHARLVRWSFGLVSVAGGLWSTAYGFQLLSESIAAKTMWASVVWVGAIPATTLWLVFVLAYTGYGQLLTRRVLAALAVEPAVMLVLVATGSPLFVERYAFVGTGSTAVVVPEAGPLLTAHLLYTLVLGLVSLVFLVQQYVHRGRLYRQQTAILLSAALVTVTTAVLTATDVAPGPSVNLTPIFFSVTDVMILVALFRYRLLDVTPVAHSTMFEELRDGVLVVDGRRHIVEANSAANSLVDTDGSPVGASLARLARADRVATLIERGGGCLEVEVDADGHPRFYEVTVTPATATEERAGYWLVVFRDVTEQRQTRAYFRALIENSRDIISVLDPDGRRTYSSPSVRHVLGYDPDDLVGMRALDIVHPDDRPHVQDAFQRVLEGDEVGRVEFRLRHGDGTWRTFESDMVGLLDDPAVEGVVVNSREITQRHRYEQRLRVFNRVLRHDIRNEMNVVLGYADLVRETAGSTEVAAYADVIYGKANTLVDLSEQTRSLDDTLGETERRRQPVDVGATVAARAAVARERYPEATVRCDAERELWAYGDDRLDDAVDNLVDNAVVHNDSAEPTVELSVTQRSNGSRSWVELTVADDGPGIPETERRVITEGIETPLEHVSGIGLWLVTWIVGNANGELAFEENDPRGSVVTVRLEAVTEDSPRPSETRTPNSVADDD